MYEIQVSNTPISYKYIPTQNPHIHNSNAPINPHNELLNRHLPTQYIIPSGNNIISIMFLIMVNFFDMRKLP